MEARGGQGSPSPRDAPSRGAGKATSTLKPSSQCKESSVPLDKGKMLSSHRQAASPQGLTRHRSSIKACYTKTFLSALSLCSARQPTEGGAPMGPTPPAPNGRHTAGTQLGVDQDLASEGAWHVDFSYFCIPRAKNGAQHTACPQ